MEKPENKVVELSSILEDVYQFIQILEDFLSKDINSKADSIIYNLNEYLTSMDYQG